MRDPEEVRALWSSVEPRLRAAAPAVHWLAMRLPPLPTEWPPTPRTRWVRYHYGAGGEPGLLDAIRVSSPYAVEHLSRGGHTERVEAVPGTPTVHTQGVRPMSGARVGPLPDAVEPLAFGLRALPTPGSDEERLLREYYRGELGGTRVVLDLVRPRHQAFFAWIEAGPAASRP